MGIIAKNIVVGGKPIPPTEPEKGSWGHLRTDQPKKVRSDKLPVDPETIVKEEKPKYHNIHDGDLHKLINTQSSYLSDMIDLKDYK